MTTTKKLQRRKSALKRLKNQLESGVKTKKGTINTKVSLTEKDKDRIKKEIEILS